MLRKGKHGVVLCLGFLIMAGAYASHECDVFQNENSRRLCLKMDRIEQKVDRALQLLETGHGGGYGSGYGQIYNPSYTCKIRVNETNIEGFGTTVVAAQTNATANCQAVGYNGGTCASNFLSCDLDPYNPSGHYKCEVKIDDRIYQGLGTSKTEARSMALKICKQIGYNSGTCYSNFHKCYPVQ